MCNAAVAKLSHIYLKKKLSLSLSLSVEIVFNTKQVVSNLWFDSVTFDDNNDYLVTDFVISHHTYISSQ